MIEQIFDDKEIRFIEKNGEYWAIASDIAKVLGFRDANTAVRYLPAHARGRISLSSKICSIMLCLLLSY
jgi:prophage antirepressor-like protein